jgi:Cu(I)/Ag(I) efflux system periplasmic protein CusF
MQGVLTRALLASVLALAPCVSLSLAGCSKKPDSGAKNTYQTRGVVKSFGPDKKFVNIAHETIPGYMAAMTMSFEPGTPTQLDGIAAGDKVSFSFSSSDDGKRVITAIKKEP